MDQAKMFSTLERRVRFDINGSWGTIPGTLRLPSGAQERPRSASPPSRNWAAEMGLTEGASNALSLRIESKRLHQLAARCHRKGSPEEQALLADLYTAQLAFDDMLESAPELAADPRGQAQLGAHLCAAIACEARTELPAELPARPRFVALAGAYADITRRLLARVELPALRHYLAAMRSYISGCMSTLGPVRIARVSDYSKLRLRRDAVAPALELTALLSGVAVCDDARAQSSFAAMREATSSCVAYLDDLFGYAPSAEAHRNLVTVHTKSYGMPLRAAMHAAMRISDRTVGQYFSAKARLEQHEAFDTASEAFVALMQDCMRGTFDWHNEGGAARYADFTTAIPA